MSLGAYLFSDLSIALSALTFLVLPVWIAYPRFRNAPRIVLFLALLGFYASLAYLKPAHLSLWALPVLALSLALWIRQGAQTSGESFFAPLKSPAVWGILAYSLIVFFFHWEPPGGDTIKWGTLGKIFEMKGVIPGDTTPITPVTDLKAADMGLSVLMAILHLFAWIPFERIVNFVICLSTAFLMFSIAAALRLWFSASEALWAAFPSLMLFTNPQCYVTWGGTPTLGGFTGGFVLIAFAKQFLDRKFAAKDYAPFALALAFGAHAHAIGIYLSILVCLPVVLYLAFKSERPFACLKAGAILGVLSLLAFSPFLRHWGMNATPAEFAEARHWQALMAPYLFRPGHTAISNLFAQLSSYLWSTASTLCLLIFVCLLWSDRKVPFLVPFLLMVSVIGVLVHNAVTWSLPLSFLIYPERAATLLVFPMAMLIGWVVRQLTQREGQGRMLAGMTCAAIFVFSMHQVCRRIYPSITLPGMTRSDRIVMERISSIVPAQDCIGVTDGGIGWWISVVSYRCTFPRHPLGFNTVTEERERPAELPWRFFANSERNAREGEGKIVLNEGARLIRRLKIAGLPPRSR